MPLFFNIVTSLVYLGTRLIYLVMTFHSVTSLIYLVIILIRLVKLPSYFF